MYGSTRKRSGAVVVTGSSSGIGMACALTLDRMGFAVFAGVRKKEDGEEVASRSSGRLRPIVLDVEDAGSIESAAESVRSALPPGAGVWGLVNNAGIGVAGPLEFLDLAELRRQFEVNCVGAVAAAQAFLPLIRQERGRIVNMGSITGRVPVPFIGPYCASKAAIAATTRALRLELAPSGVRCVLVEPGTFKTRIWEKHASRTEQLSGELPEAARLLYGPSVAATALAAERRAASSPPPQAVADAVARALSSRRPKDRYVVGMDAKAGALLDKCLPGWAVDEMMVRFMRLPRRAS